MERLEYPKTPKLYPNEERFSVCKNGDLEKTLQSIDCTLKRIETILRQNQIKTLSCVLDDQIPLAMKLSENLIDLHAESK